MSHWSYVNKFTREAVEAYEFHADSGQHTTAYPRWLLDLLLDNKIESQDDGKTWFYERMTPIPDGDWVVWDNRVIRIWTADDFAIYFVKT